MQALDSSWLDALGSEFTQGYFRQIADDLKAERNEGVVYPPPNQVFEAFRVTPLDKIRVVILGQDPYHGAGQAHGLSFSVLPGVPIPPSLRNVYKELKADLGYEPPKHGNLLPWARQGVFLLNSVLTVRAGEAASHQALGWEKFTNRVIQKISSRGNVVFILWGKFARDKMVFIDHDKNQAIVSPHPSPKSADTGFFGSRPFSRANEYLRAWGRPEVDWKLPEVESLGSLGVQESHGIQPTG
jgi:uracil-DNA glycosylase